MAQLRVSPHLINGIALTNNTLFGIHTVFQTFFVFISIIITGFITLLSIIIDVRECAEVECSYHAMR